MAESAGGYDYDFLTVIPEDLICTLCHFPFQNPLQIEHCGHIFCKECYEQIKDHAETNNVELCCPLDRHIIDVTRVFNDKSDERKVLSLKVKCPNFAVGCAWTGELREALDHERKCCKNQTAVNHSFEMELKKILKRMTELEIKVQCQEVKLEDKQKHLDIQTHAMENQNKQIENQKKQMDNQNKQIENQKTQMKDLQKQIDEKNKQIENQVANQKKQIEFFKKKFEDLNEQVEDQNKIIMDLKIKMENKVIQIHNPSNKINEQESVIKKFDSWLICSTSSIMPVCTAFQWKFNADEVRSDKYSFCSPFYNTLNAMCFVVMADFDGNYFHIGLGRVRGKYDHATDEITKTTPFNFTINIFGNNGNRKVIEFNSSEPICVQALKISFSKLVGICAFKSISSEEIDNFIIDGDVCLHGSFNNMS